MVLGWVKKTIVDYRYNGLYDIQDRKTVFELLKVAENELSKYYSDKAKQRETMAKRGR